MVPRQPRTGTFYSSLQTLRRKASLVPKQADFRWATSDSSGSDFNRFATGWYIYKGAHEDQVSSNTKAIVWLVKQFLFLFPFFFSVVTLTGTCHFVTSFMSFVIILLSDPSGNWLRLRGSVKEQSGTSCDALYSRESDLALIDRDSLNTLFNSEFIRQTREPIEPAGIWPRTRISQIHIAHLHIFKSFVNSVTSIHQ